MLVCKKQFETKSGGLLARAPAKINLSLLIAGKRPDGYHEIETLMVKINFYDEILIQPGKKPGIELICTGPHWTPKGEDNLVYQAAKMLLETCDREENIKITLTKNIPAGSGLGSASSDAAATLIGLNKFLKLKVPKRKLARIAAQLGSDVAFFLNGPLALCSGKGEKIKKLYKNFNFHALLILPDVNVSTKRVYDNYQHNPDLYNQLNARIKKYIHKNRIDLVPKMCANMLQISCFSLHKELAELKEKIEALGIGPLCLSGSGSTLFYIIDRKTEKKVKWYQNRLEKKFGCRTIIVSNNRW